MDWSFWLGVLVYAVLPLALLAAIVKSSEGHGFATFTETTIQRGPWSHAQTPTPAPREGDE